MKEKFVIRMISMFSIQFFDLIVGFIKLRYLSIEIFGLYALANSLSTLFTMFLDLGITAIHYQNNTKPDFEKYVGSFFLIKVGLIFINYLIAFIYLWFVDYDPTTKLLAFYVMLSNLLCAFITIFLINLQIRLKYMKTEIVNIILRLIMNITTIYIVINFNSIENALFLIVIIPLFVHFSTLVIFVIFNFHEKFNFRPRIELIKEYFINAKPFIIQSIITVISSNIGYILLAQDFGNAELSYYYVVQNYFLYILLSLSSSTSVIFDSLFPKMLAEKQTQQIIEICHQFEKYASILFAIVFFGVILYAEPLIQIILPQYIPSVIFMQVMVIIPYFDGLLRPYWGIIYQGKKNQLTAMLGLFNMFLNLILQIVLISKNIFGIPLLGLGSWGFVIINLFFTIEQFTIYRILAKKYFNITPIGIKIIIHPLIAFVSFIITYFLNIMFLEKMLENKLIFSLVSASLLIILYVGMLIITKQVKKEDFSFVKALINPMIYVRSLKEELNNPSTYSDTQMPLKK